MNPAAQEWAATQELYKDYPKLPAIRVTLRDTPPANRLFPVTEISQITDLTHSALDTALTEQGNGKNPLFVFFSSPTPPFEALAAGSCSSVECELYRRSNYFCFEDLSGLTTPLQVGEGRYCTNARCATQEGGFDYIDVLAVRAPTTQVEAETIVKLFTHVACEANNDDVILAVRECDAPFQEAIYAVIHGEEGYIRELILA